MQLYKFIKFCSYLKKIIPEFADNSQGYQYRHDKNEACDDMVAEL